MQLILQDCIAICKKAGELVLDYYQNASYKIDHKADDSPVTTADKKANVLITEALLTRYPDVAMLSEESVHQPIEERVQNPYCFIVDPIDGTKSFINNSPEFTVNIALTHNQKPIIGAVYAPALDKLYYASKEKGAFLLHTKTNKTRPIKVSGKTRDLIMVASKSHITQQELDLYEAHRSNIKKLAQIGSSLKGCLVADGSADVYYKFGPLSEWDIAAMHCVVESAGGVFETLQGDQIVYNNEDTTVNGGFYAVNSRANIFV